MTSYVLDMPEAVYHSHPALSSTGVRSLLRCPSRFALERVQGRPNKAEFDFGSLVHGVILGAGWPLAIWPGESWGEAGGAAFKREAYAEGKIPVKQTQVEEAGLIARRVLLDPVARWYFAHPGVNEISLFWTDAETGVDCRARLDRLTETEDGQPLYVEVKTTSDASRHGIRSHTAKYGYHCQQEWNLDGLVYSGLDPLARARCTFVVVETIPPYPVTVVNLDDEFARLGRERNRKGLRLYDECTRTGIWPDYEDREITITPPRWLHYEED